MNFPSTGPNILIVEDRDEIRSQLRECIRSVISPSTISEASDSAVALKLLEQTQMHLLIVDARLVRAQDMAILRLIPNLSSDKRPQYVFLISETFAAPPVYSPRSRVVPFPIPLSTDVLTEQIRVRLLPKAPIPQGPKVDIQVFDIFQRGIRLVFKKLAGLEISRSRAYLRKGEPLNGDIASILKLVSPYFDGQMSIIMKSPLFVHVVNKILGTQYTAIDDENADAIAEIANQVYGFSKRELNTVGFNLEPSIPSIVRGEKCSFQPPSEQQLHLCMEFQISPPSAEFPEALPENVQSETLYLELQLNDLTKLAAAKPETLPTP